jgi:bacterioferritin
MGDKAKVQQDNSRVLECLQDAVNAETMTRNLYWARSVFWRSVGMSKLADYYLMQSAEDHAQCSADRMAFLGRQPAVAPQAVASITDDSVADHLRVDLQVEVALADSYQEWIKIAEDAGDYTTRFVWARVLKNTQEHVDLLQGWLRQIETMGEDNWMASWRGGGDTGGLLTLGDNHA